MTKAQQAARKTLTTDARAVAERCAGIGIRQAARRITRFLDDAMRAAGLSAAQFGLMIEIAAADDDTIGGLAARTGLDQSTLSRNLRGLERDGLVEITIVQADLRRRAVWLTEEGARRLETAIPLWRRAHRKLAAEVDPEMVRRIAAGAARLAT